MATAVKKRTLAARTYTAEERRVRTAVETHLPSVKDVVRSYDIEFRKDHAGEPAVYVTLRVPKESSAKPGRIKRLLDFSQRVQREILEQDATYFPYVTLVGTAHR